MQTVQKQQQYNDHVVTLYKAADGYLAEHPETADVLRLAGLSEPEVRAAVMIELMKRQAAASAWAADDPDAELRVVQAAGAVSRAQALSGADQGQALEEYEDLFEDVSDVELPLPSPATLNRALWSTAKKNDLPDSSFAYIEPGGTKDKEGKTTPRSKRHLPYKDADGKPDAAHVKNALARLSSTQIPASAKASALRKIKGAARRLGIKVGPNSAVA